MKHSGPLIKVATLAARLGDAQLRIVDCRHDLSDPAGGRRAYAAGHIPGALFMHLDEDLSGPCNSRNGRHPLPTPAAFRARLGALGISPSHAVVAYDDAGGAMAARLWWMLRWIGHEQVAVLDGGWPAWLAAGQTTESQPGTPAPTTYPAPANEAAHSPAMPTLDAAALQQALTSGTVKLVDARAPERFAGRNETLDPVGGHIPGALNHFFRNNLTAEGFFRPAGELRAQFTALLGQHPPEQVVQQCGSGVTACHNLLAMEVAGLPGARLYPGSWSEWCSDPSRPVATGTD